MRDEPDRSIWPGMLAHLRAHHPAVCRHWFEELRPAGVQAGTILVRVEEEIRRRYLQRECAEVFAEAAQAASGRLLAVRFIGFDEAGPAATSKATGNGHPNGVSHGAAHAPAHGAGHGALRPEESDDELPISPDHVFESFVVGPNNRLAHAAARAVADQVGQSYNPLFIHGGVGVGKSHLLQAICNRLLERDAGVRTLYINCNVFITRYLEAVRDGRMSEFRARFRNVDFLVVDDIHFLGDREQSQEEFFHTFNTLFQSQRQIILSSDAPPDQIPSLEERLTSRLAWGLVAEMTPPDYETRVGILQTKAKDRGVDLPNDVACFIAARFDQGVREMEGALTSVQVNAEMDGIPVTMDLAKRALGAPEQKAAGYASIERIIDCVAEYYGVPVGQILSKRRHRSIALPRHVCMYLARYKTRHSLEEIGGYLGGRDHTTVLYGIRVIEEAKERDRELSEALKELERVISG